MIKMVNLFNAIQLPGNAGSTRCINRNTHANIRVEKCEAGLELHFGKLTDGKWQATGLVKTVTWANVADFDEERSVKDFTGPAKEPGGATVKR